MLRKKRTWLVAVFAGALLLPAAAVYAAAGGGQGDGEGTETHQLTHSGGTEVFSKVDTRNIAQVTSSTAFVELSANIITVPANSRSLITAEWSGETACSGGGATSNWCSMRINIGGVEGNPVAGLDFAIDSTDGGTARSDDWEGHSLKRTRCFVNTSTSPVNVIVQVQWAVRNLDGGSAPVFRTDDWAFEMSRSSGCTVAST